MHETIQQVLRDRLNDDAVAVMYGDRTWTWREHLAEAAAEASALIGLADPSRPLHVGALLGNTPAMLRSMAAAALGGYVLCGINTTRRGEACSPTSVAPIVNCCWSIRTICRCWTELDLTGVTVLDVTSRRLPRGGRVRGAAGAAPRGRRHRPADADLHLGHQRQPQGGAVRPRDGGAEREQPGRCNSTSPRTTSATCRCRCSTPTGWRAGGRWPSAGRDDGAGQVLGVAVPRRHSPLRRHVHELRRQAAGAGAGHPGADPTTPTTRCASRSATRPPTATSRSSPAGSAAG